MTGIIPSPVSLAMTKLGTLGGGLALARQVKVVLSAVLRGSKVREAENDGLEPVTEEVVTLASLLVRRVLPLSQVMSISDMAISVSVAELMEMVQVRVRGAMRPAKRGPGGTLMSSDCMGKILLLTQGVAMYIAMNLNSIVCTMEVVLLLISSSSLVEGINTVSRAGEVKVPLHTKLSS